MAISAEQLARIQQTVSAALWRYTTTPASKPYYVRGCIPDVHEPQVTVALWTGPDAREKRNLFLRIPLLKEGTEVSAMQVVLALQRLGHGTHLLGSTGRRFDGKRVLDGSALITGPDAPDAPAAEEDAVHEGPRGFYFESPGQLKRY
ncbi:hypothetical protein GTW43_26345 [Streptomyces sp. SID5785]|uniref:hypothetical protein n=1 Tax=Streptomyces sp. SID5785 TaxID=2690309 RepID=UPI001361DD0E|nr:hypothetical protein [Streptomyces sp. SID5785]MZD08573.1 hypothetical protein [Streptomyces sp. SID5785]